MPKIEHIKKARKDWKCRRCGAEIKKGQPYYKAKINFGPTIVRCTACKLQPWEATTSEFTLAVGEIANRWQENFPLDESIAEDLSSALQELFDDQQDKLDNIPESLQYSTAGETISTRIDMLEVVQSELDCVNIDQIKSDAVEAVMPDTDEYDEDADYDYDSLMSSESIYEGIKSNLKQALDNILEETIEEILGNLEY